MSEDCRVSKNSFCCKCKHVTDDTKHNYVRTKNDRLRKQTTCQGCGTKKSTFISQREGGALTEDEKGLANNWSHMAASSYKAPADRIKFLKDAGIEDYEMSPSDDEFQDDNTAVYKNKAGKRVVSFRGTKPTDKHDMLADLGIVKGTFNKTKRYKDWDNTMSKVVAKHGSDNIERIASHSLGARMGLEMGKKHNIASENFNTGSSPVDIPKNVLGKLKCSTIGGKECGLNKKHRNWLVNTDPVGISTVVSPYTNRYIYQRQANPHGVSNWFYK